MKSYSSTIYHRRGYKYLGRLFQAFYLVLYHSNSVDIFEDFEKKNICYINLYMDGVLAVSERVRELLIKHEIDENKISTSYIGTRVADEAMYSPNANNTDSDYFKIVYMGYMRPEKGYYFFINALEKLQDDYSKHIDVRIVARYAGKIKEVTEIDNLRHKFHDIELIDGYTKDNQKELLQGCHLGGVPVLWEDNLPQVAIEQIAYGVPILVSDFGGQKSFAPMKILFLKQVIQMIF